MTISKYKEHTDKEIDYILAQAQNPNFQSLNRELLEGIFETHRIMAVLDSSIRANEKLAEEYKAKTQTEVDESAGIFSPMLRKEPEAPQMFYGSEASRIFHAGEERSSDAE